ncbi:unnamed protein product [Durusdinium trenchii]|uniref:Pentatricopeptide repeat-containing protein At5g21222 (SNF1-like protein kinase AtC401) n=2 Tax=Durusdinium trenchii TaxID=1381693 RepID=A0ABP0MV94_9DINO
MWTQRTRSSHLLFCQARLSSEVATRDTALQHVSGMTSTNQVDTFQKKPTVEEVEARYPSRARLWTVLRVCASHGDPCRVHAWLRRHSNEECPEADPRMADFMIHAYAKVADLARAEKALVDMIRNRVHPTTESFNAILAACARKEDVSSALKWFGRMLEADLVPDIVTYRTLISTCARAGNLPLAEEWLGKMLRATRRLDVVSCSSIIGGYASTGDAHHAQKWLERMLAAGLRPSGYAFNPVICVWSYADPSKSEAWIWKAMEAGSKPSDAALQRTLAGYVQNHNWEGCLRMKDLLKRLKRWPSSWAIALLAKPHAAAGDFESIEELIQELHVNQSNPDASCFKALLAAYARSPRPVEDERVELCCEQLFALVSLEPSLLGDARRALGQERYQRLASRLGLNIQPQIHRKGHARNRVVGSWGEIPPA